MHIFYKWLIHKGNFKPSGGESCPFCLFFKIITLKLKWSHFLKNRHFFNRKNHVFYVCLLNNANNGLAQLTEKKPDLLWVCVCVVFVKKIPWPVTPKLFLRPYFQDTYSYFFCINLIKFLLIAYVFSCFLNSVFW